LCIRDGKWEEFLQVNLPHLNKFKFSLKCWKLIDHTREELQSILESFQTPFWIEHKKWFVACEFSPEYRHTFHIYSMPICETRYGSELYSTNCFFSLSNQLISFNNINEIALGLNEPVNNIDSC